MLTPGQDLTGQQQRVQNVASAVWTTEVIAAYNSSLPQPLRLS